VVGMKPGARKTETLRLTRDARIDDRDAWSPDRAAWTLTPPALIPFGSFVPPRSSRRTGKGNDRR